MTAQRSVATGLLSIALLCAVRPANPAENRPELKKIADDVYVRIVSPDGSAVGNAGIAVFEHGVLVFDAHFTPEAGREFLEQIRSVTPKPVRYVVNSHFHPDHTHGNQAFVDAHFIGSTATRRDVLNVDLASMNRAAATAQRQLEKLRLETALDSEKDQGQRRRDIQTRENYLKTISHLKIIPPAVTLDDCLIIQDGKEEAKLCWLGPGHTEGDIVLYLPHRRIAFLGDLFFNEAIPNVQDARMLDWIVTLREALKLKADQFIPGHGPVGTRKDVETFLGYLEELKSLVESAITRGSGMEQATQEIQIPAKYSTYKFQNFFPLNIQKMFSELKALEIGSNTLEGPSRVGRDKTK